MVKLTCVNLSGDVISTEKVNEFEAKVKQTLKKHHKVADWWWYYIEKLVWGNFRTVV